MLQNDDVAVLRAAFDFGSAATKMALAECGGQGPSSRLTILYEKEMDLLVGLAWRTSSDSCIPSETQSELFQIVERFLQVIQSFSASSSSSAADPGNDHDGDIGGGGRKENAQQQPSTVIPTEGKRTTKKVILQGIATAVYRDAKNGPDILRQLQAQYGIPVTIISQEEEGRLGFASGAALYDFRQKKSSSSLLAPLFVNDQNSHKMLVWDLGGSSFQITYGSASENKVEKVYGGGWGDSKVCFDMATKIQGRKGSDSNNPATQLEWSQFVEYLVQQLSQTDISSTHDAPGNWLLQLCSQVDSTSSVSSTTISPSLAPVVAIGGPTAAFRIAALATNTAEGITAQAIEQGAIRLVGKTDKEIESLGFPQPEMVIPKLALIYAVMVVFKIPSFVFFDAIGSTAGMLRCEDYWV